MEAQCMICKQFFTGKEIVQLACVPHEWDEGLANQWRFCCWKHDGVEENADTCETERFHKSEMREYVIPPFKAITGWRK